MRSLQRTLALRYGVTMLVALLAFALVTEFSVRAMLARHLARYLEMSSDRMAAAVASAPGPEAVALSPLSQGALVVVRDSAGRVLISNSPRAESLPLDTRALAGALAGQRAWVDQELRGERIRSLFRPVGNGEHVALAVQASASLEPMREVSQRLLLQLLLTSLVGALAASFGAAWLARRSLAPIGELAEQARAVTAPGASSFVTLHGDVAELRDLIQVLNDMLARLEHALAVQRRIIADVGHELRTPITVMRGEIEVALRGQREPAQYRGVLASVLEEVDRLALMGDQLIALARYQAGDLTLQLQPVDLATLARRRAELHRERAPSAAIDVALPDRRVDVDADAALLDLVIGQLLDNAIRHTPDGTPIRIAVERSPDKVSLVVEDAGPGVADEALGSLTEPFYRGDPARTRGGVGLGLSVVAAIISLHRGSVILTRSPMGGLRNEVSLPVAG
ncbi:MAG TPA: ATP-binding protein [Gemmatimonadales bacterium]|nr:ATP-binding protein [Gemmatimonadales bacterium]